MVLLYMVTNETTKRLSMYPLFEYCFIYEDLVYNVQQDIKLKQLIKDLCY